MIAVLKQGTSPEQTEHLVTWLKRMNLDVHISEGQEMTVLGLIGDTSRVDIDLLKSLEIVETVKRVSEPYKQANRKFHPIDSIIDCGGVKIGGGKILRKKYAGRTEEMKPLEDILTEIVDLIGKKI